MLLGTEPHFEFAKICAVLFRAFSLGVQGVQGTISRSEGVWTT